MKRPILRIAAFLLVGCMATTSASYAQAVFQIANAPNANIPSYFQIGPTTGLFQIDDPTLPSIADNTTATITTLHWSVSFSIGVATPTIFSYRTGYPFADPYVPPQPPPSVIPPLEIEGVSFSGSFQSSPNLYAELLTGLGQFRIGSGDISQIQVVATPEPGSAALFLGGLMLLLWRGRKLKKSLRGS